MIHNRPLQYVLFAMYQEDPLHHKFIKLDAGTFDEAWEEAKVYCHAKDQLLIDNYGNQYPIKTNREFLMYIPKDRCVTQTEFRSCRSCFFRIGDTGKCCH